MIPYLIHLRPLDLLTGTRSDIFIGSASDATALGLGGIEWEPALVRRPRIAQDLMSLDLDGKFKLAAADFVISLGQIHNHPDPSRLMWGGARLTIYSAVDLSWSRRVTEFNGIVANGPPDLITNRLTINATVDRTRIDKPLLTAEFTGGGGENGEPAMRGKVKPAGFGYVENCEWVLFDTINNIGMLDGYGNLVEVVKAMEGLNDLGPRVADYPTYQALKDAITSKAIAPGRWGTCIAQGMVGFGAPLTGRVSFVARFGSTRTGAIIKRILTVHGKVDVVGIDQASLTALDTTADVEVRAFFTEQIQIADLIEQMCQPLNATPLITVQNRIAVTRAAKIDPQFVLNRNGSALPMITDWRAADTVDPLYKASYLAEQPASVFTFDQVNYADDLIDRGLYSADETYRQGNIVWLSDKSQWLYISETPTKGNAPATGSAYWKQMQPGADVNTIKYPSGYSLADKEPGEKGANVTENRTASGIAGQGAFATMNSAGYGSQYLTGFGTLSPLNNLYFGSPYLLEGAGGSSATLNAFKTILGIASGFTGQGALASLSQLSLGSGFLTGFGSLAGLSSLGYGSPLLTGFGGLSPLSSISFGSNYLLEQAGGALAGLNAFKTILGTAAGISGQGFLATQNAVDYNSRILGLPAGIDPQNIRSDGYFDAFWTKYYSGRNVVNLEPQESGANVTEGRTSAAFLGQGIFATSGPLGRGSIFNGFFNADTFGLGSTLTRNNGAVLTEGDAITSLGTSAAIFGQGWGATAAQGSVDNSYSSAGVNVIPNSDQTLRKSWRTQYNPNGAVFAAEARYASDAWGTDSYTLPGKIRNIYSHQEGFATGTVDGSGDGAVAVDHVLTNDDGSTFYMPCAPNERIIASCFVATHRCNFTLILIFQDKDGNSLNAPASGIFPATNNATNILSEPYYKRPFVVAIAPAQAVRCTILVRKYNTYAGGTPNSFIWMAAPMLERAKPNQSEPSPYNPGAATSTRDIGYGGDLDATNTGRNTASAIMGQSPWATYGSLIPTLVANQVQNLSQAGMLGATKITDSGATSGRYLSAYFPVTTGADKTSNATSAGFTGQGALATKSKADFGQDVSNVPYTQITSNYFPMDAWVAGRDMYQANYGIGPNVSSDTKFNSIIVTTGPGNTSQNVLKMVSGNSGEGQGGFNQTQFTVDKGFSPRDGYRFSIWVYREANASGTIYFGLSSEPPVYHAATNGVDTNPYFWAGGLAPNKWWLVVGILHGSDQAAYDSGLSGVYDPETGYRVQAGSDYRLHPSATRVGMRAYQYYTASADSTSYFARPRIERISEGLPTVASLMSAAALRNADQKWSQLNNDNGGLPAYGADVTRNNTAAAILGQSGFATSAGLTREMLFSGGFFNVGAFSLDHTITRSDGSTRVTESMAITQLGVAAGFVNQGGLATRDTADFATQVNGAGKPVTYRVSSRGNGAGGSTPPGYQHGLWTDNQTAINSDYRRSYTVCWQNRATGVWSSRPFDVYGGGVADNGYGTGNAANGPLGMANYLNSIPIGCPVIVFTSDEPLTNRGGDGLLAAMYRCGASRTTFGGTWISHGAYILVGYAGAGEGNGIEKYEDGGEPASPRSFVETSFTIVNGLVQAGGKTLTSAGQLQYADGVRVGDRQPAQAGSDVTRTNTAAGISGQGFLATQNAVDYNSRILGLPAGIDPQNIRSDGYFDAFWFKYYSGRNVVNLEPQESGSNVTENRSSAGFAGQGSLATQNTIGSDSQLSGNIAQRLAPYAGDSRYLAADRVAWEGGDTVQNYKPQERGANITENRTSAALAGQSYLATNYPGRLQPSPQHGESYLAASAMAFSAGYTVEDLRPGERGSNVTETRVASAVYGQSQLATASFGLNAAGAIEANNIDKYGTGRLNDFWPQEGGSNRTESRTAAAIVGQSGFATSAGITRDQIFSAGFFNLNAFSLGYSVTRSDGSTRVTESMTITQLGVAAGFVNQGGLATRNNINFNDIVSAGRVTSRVNGAGRGYELDSDGLRSYADNGVLTIEIAF